MQKVSEIFPEKYHKILDSILPGGDNWQEGERECIKSCPYHSSCEFWGPSRKLCSDEWRVTPLKPMALMVIKHVFDNFDFYNTKDLPYSENAPMISEIREILEFPFDESLSPTEIQSVVKVRIRQAEFKNNLFTLWGGCSLCNCEIDPKYLVASHIVPWAKSTDEEKVSCFNGLLLPANYDYLFDRHLISFSDTGELLVANGQSSELDPLYEMLGIDRASKLAELHGEMQPYMTKHRDQFFQITEAISNNQIQQTPKNGAAD